MLADWLDLSRFTVSRQLRLMSDAGLVVGHKLVVDRRGVLCTINPRLHGAITAWLAGTDVGRSVDPAAAAGTPPSRRVVNDPWREFRHGPRQRGDGTERASP